MSERLKYCSSIIGDLRIMLPIIITLLGGTVYGNSDTVKRWVHGPLPTVPGEVSNIVEGGFQEQVIEHVRTNNEKLKEIEAKIKRLEAIRKTGDSALEARIARIEDKVQ